MGCGPSKDAVLSIETTEDGKVRKKSGKKIKVVSSDEALVNDANAAHIGAKSTSAKSRDSGIGEMEYGRSNLIDGVITEESDPHLVQDIEKERRPNTPDLQLVGRQFQNKSAGRIRSKAILEELEAEGLISGSKVERGGAAFEVKMGPLQPLEPLAPIRRPPPRLERMKSEKKILSKAELEEKMRKAETRRKENLEKKSRLASQLARDQALAVKLHSDSDNEHDQSDSPNIATKSTAKRLDLGDGEGRSSSDPHSIFDKQSTSSDEDTDFNKVSPTESTDMFFKESTPTHNSFSQESAFA